MKPKKISFLFCLVVLLSFCSHKTDEGIFAAGAVDGEVVTVKALALGRITTLDFEEGDRIEKGEILVRIDTEKILNKIEGLELSVKEIRINRRKLESRREFLQSTQEYWKTQTERLERLHKKESVSGDELKKARLKKLEVESSLNEIHQTLLSLSVQLENIQVQRKGLQLQLEDALISSPLSGIVLERFVSEGETVLPGTAVADILDPESLFIEVFVEEQELVSLKLGDKVQISADGIDTKFSGSIIHFNRKAEFSPKYIISEKERKSLLYGLKIRLDEGKDVMKIGMPVTVIIRGGD